MEQNIFDKYFNNPGNYNNIDEKSNNIIKINIVNKNNTIKKKVNRKYINQLFVTKPSRIFVENLLKLFIPNGFNEYYTFTINKLKDNKILDKMNEIYFLKHFKMYYINCKYNTIFKNFTEKKAITVLRQFLRIYNYNIIACEKYINSEKFKFYKLKNINNNISNKDRIIKKIFKKNISFD